MVRDRFLTRRSVLGALSTFPLSSVASSTAQAQAGTQTNGTSGGTTETGTPSSSNTPLSLSNPRVMTIDAGFGEELVGEVTITNESDSLITDFQIGMDWINKSGAYMATTDLYGGFLAPGETWIARTYAWLDVENTSQIGSLETAITDMNPFGDLIANPEGIELVDPILRASEEDVVVRGQIKNNRNTQEFLNASVQVYDGEETIIGIGDSIEEVPSGGTWQFEIAPDTVGRNGQVEYATVVPYI